jgi:hypothetical protein
MMKGAGPEPHLWWFMEAANPYNVTSSSQGPSMHASMSSCHCHQTHHVIDSPVTSDTEIDNALHVDNAEN